MSLIYHLDLSPDSIDSGVKSETPYYTFCYSYSNLMIGNYREVGSKDSKIGYVYGSY